MSSVDISVDVMGSGRLRSIGTVCLLVVGALIAVGVVGMVVLLLLLAIGITPNSTVGYITQVIVQQLVFGGVTVAYAAYSDTELLARLPSLREIGWIVGGVALLLGLSQTIGLLLQYGGVGGGTNQIERLARQQPQLLLYLIPVAVVFIGPGEELLFRGGVQGRLREAFAPTPAIVLASVLFGLVHVPAVVASSPVAVGGYVVTAFALGLMLGALYEHTDNLLVPALVHGVYNAVLFAYLYLQIT